MTASRSSASCAGVSSFSVELSTTVNSATGSTRGPLAVCVVQPDKAQTILQERQNLTAYQLQQEAAQLRERIPEWRDPAKYEAGAQELRGYLINQGADPAEVDTLSSSLAVSIARKAMLYDKLVYQKHSKSKQLRSAPPVVRPGAAPSSDAGKVSFAKAQQALRNAGKTGTARKQEEILLGMLNRTFKA